jgi:hypothetical protein
VDGKRVPVPGPYVAYTIGKTKEEKIDEGVFKAPEGYKNAGAS